MNASIYNARNLPRFLAGTYSNSDREFLIHCHAPRFIGRMDPQDDGSITMTAIEWIDPPPEGPAECAKLMREAGEWWSDEESSLEEE